MEMENIGYYLKFCWHLGLPSSDLFITSDLYERKGEGEVVRNLLALARHCQSKQGWKGPLLPSLPPPARVALTTDATAPSPARPKHWPLPGPRPPTYVTDAPEPPSASSDPVVQRLEAEVAALRSELARVRAERGGGTATDALRRVETERDEALARVAALQLQLMEVSAAASAGADGAELLITALDRLLLNESISSEEMVELNTYFKSERGRRHFAKQLKRTLKRVPSLVLCDQSFETLLWLFNTVLALQQASPAPDFIAARMLMVASCSIVRRGTDGAFESLRDHIRAYDLWQLEPFWQELLYAELAANYREALSLEIEVFMQTVVPSLVLTIAYSMLFDWQLPAALVRTFVSHALERNAIHKATAQATLEELKEYSAAVAQPGGERCRALQARLAKKEQEQEEQVKRLVSRGSSSGLSRGSSSGVVASSSSSSSSSSPLRPHEHSLVPRARTAHTVKCHQCRKNIWSHTQKALLCSVCGFSVRAAE